MASALDIVAGLAPGQGDWDPYADFQQGRAQGRANAARPLMGQALQGDANALNSLAGIDPQGFMEVSGFQDKRAQAGREEAAAKADRVASLINWADTPEKWEIAKQRIKASGVELEPQEEDFNSRGAMLAEHMSLKEQLAQGNAQRGFDIRDRGLDIQEQRLAQGPGGGTVPSGYRLTADGTGLEPIPGGPADPNKQVPVKSLRPTTDQNNAAGFYDRLVDAEAVLSDPNVVNAAIDYVGKTKANLPFGAGNYLATPEYQKFDQAQRNFINAVLRKESGAAIAESEFANAAQQYFPQPGDSPEKIAQKAQNRATVIRAMERTAAGALTQGQQPAPQETGAVEGEIPTQAVEELLADPSGAAEFDEVFGPGAAAQVLGQQ